MDVDASIPWLAPPPARNNYRVLLCALCTRARRQWHAGCLLMYDMDVMENVGKVVGQHFVLVRMGAFLVHVCKVYPTYIPQTTFYVLYATLHSLRTAYILRSTYYGGTTNYGGTTHNRGTTYYGGTTDYVLLTTYDVLRTRRRINYIRMIRTYVQHTTCVHTYNILHTYIRTNILRCT